MGRLARRALARPLDGIECDDVVEAIVVRIGRLVKHFKTQTAAVLVEISLQEHEYETLHLVMIRDTLVTRRRPRWLPTWASATPA